MGHFGNVKYKNRNRVEDVYPNADRGGWALRSPGELLLPPDDVTKILETIQNLSRTWVETKWIE